MIKTANYGTKFEIWCESQNRLEPPAVIVDALNEDMDKGIALAKGYSADPLIYRNLITYMAGKGRLSNV